MNHNRTRSAQIALVLLATSITFSPSAGAEQEGDFTYSAKNGSITITKYTGNAGSIAIPAKIAGQPVKAIGPGAFANSQATAITIPEGITDILQAAFGNCPKLTELTIPPNVKTLGFEAFSRCASLTTVTFEGNAPALDNARNAPALFFKSAPGFTVRYYKGNTGFTTPEWNGYKTIEVARAAAPK